MFDRPAPSPSARVEDILLAPFRLNDRLTLKNRILLAPCTRNRAIPGLVPTTGAVRHYADRARAGLLVSEGIIISPEAQGSPATPGLFSDAQVAGWASVTEAVHARDGLIFGQLWHLGRMAHSFYSGRTALAPSAVLDDGKHRGDRYYDFRHETPEPMSEADIERTIADYARASRNAIRAGFDGVEIHGANGYLPEQFLRAHTNRRTDCWGGAPENRARFLIAVVEACGAEIGFDRVGLRVSPAAHFADMVFTPGDEEALLHVLDAVSRLDLAYLHTGVDDDIAYDYLGGTSSAFLRRHYAGVLVGCGGYTPRTAAVAIGNAEFDLAAFGRTFLANADLVDRIEADRPLRRYTRRTFEDLK